MNAFVYIALTVALLFLAGVFLAACVLVSLVRELLQRRAEEGDPAAEGPLEAVPASDPDLDRMTGAPW